MRPNLFLVGAPKCGTTYLSNLLRQHPEIGITTPKEPHFFGSDLLPPTDRFIRDESQYLNLFAGMRDKQWAGEASTWYLVSDTAAQEIKRYSPDAKIIAIVREPVAQMFSLFSHRVYAENEDRRSFREALSLEKDRQAGRSIPEKLSNTATGLQYTKAASHGANLARYFEVFDVENIKVILFDDLIDMPDSVMQEIFLFLGVDDADIEYSTEMNPSKRARTLEQQKLIRLVPQSLKTAIRSRLGHRVQASISRLLSLAEGTRPVMDLDDAELTELHAQFAQDIRVLEAMIGRDLKNWERA